MTASPTKNLARPSTTMNVSSYGWTWRRGPAPGVSVPYASTVTSPPSASPSTEPRHGPSVAGSNSLASVAARPSGVMVDGSKSLRAMQHPLIEKRGWNHTESRNDPARHGGVHHRGYAMSTGDRAITRYRSAERTGARRAKPHRTPCALAMEGNRTDRERTPSRRDRNSQSRRAGLQLQHGRSRHGRAPSPRSAVTRVHPWCGRKARAKADPGPVEPGNGPAGRTL